MIKILQGDWIERLRELPDRSVHCVVTSPPYWGLRDYGIAGQLGPSDAHRWLLYRFAYDQIVHMFFGSEHRLQAIVCLFP